MVRKHKNKNPNEIKNKKGNLESGEKDRKKN